MLYTGSIPLADYASRVTRFSIGYRLRCHTLGRVHCQTSGSADGFITRG